MGMHTCKKCGRTMDDTNFYTSKNLEKYPNDGKLDDCKKCITMHINNYEPTTYLWILKEVDAPYIEEEWNVILEKYGSNGKKLTGTSIIGRYLSKMKLNQWKDYHWEDSQRLREEMDIKKGIQKTQDEYMKNGIYKAMASGEISELSDYQELEDEFGTSAIVEAVNLENDLTQEDRTYLTMKWGKLYKPEDWIKLEEFYNNMMNSFDIQNAAHLDYLMFICKTSLKMNQALDIGDIDGFQKLSKTYDSLMKSAKFTAAQNKAESGEFVDSVGELVALCEEQGFIPKFVTSEPQDIVDKTLADFKGYTYKLVTEEMGLGDKIEAALQEMQRQEEQEEGELDEDEDYLDPDSTAVLEDADYEEFYDELENQQEEDAESAIKEE